MICNKLMAIKFFCVLRAPPAVIRSCKSLEHDPLSAYLVTENQRYLGCIIVTGVSLTSNLPALELAFFDILTSN